MEFEAKIFDDECQFEEENAKYEEPTIVFMENDEILISKDEAELLALGPKFCTVKNLCKESFECEIEEAIVKYRWEIMGEEIEVNNKKKDPNYDAKFEEAYEVMKSELYSKEEIEVMDEEERIKDAELRLIYLPEKEEFDLSKRRVTDLKGNSRVVLPKGSKNFDFEAKIQTFRTELLDEFRKHVAEKCGKNGK